MPAHYWFEIRGTESYHLIPYKDDKKERTSIVTGERTRPTKPSKHKKPQGKPTTRYRPLDWDKKLPSTREDYQRQAKKEDVGGQIIRKRENEELQRVDTLICEFMGDPPPPRSRDSRFYHLIHELGFWSLYKLGGSHVTIKHVKFILNHIATHPELRTELEFNEGQMARLEMLVRWVFQVKWVFHATG